MSGVLARAAELFLAPAAAEPPVARAALPAAIRAVVLGAPSDAVPLAAALALSLRAACRARATVVAVWSSEPMEPHAVTPSPEGRRRSTSRSAAALAARLSAGGLPAGAGGRLVWLRLPGEASAAASAVRRASSVVEGPLVTALSGPRPAELDELVAEHDLAVVAADPEAALARAALASLTGRGVTATAHHPPRRGLPRALAVAGLVAPRIDLAQAGVDVARAGGARFEGAS